MSNKSPKGPTAAAAPRRNNNLKAAQQRLLLRQMEERLADLAKKFSGLSVADEEVSRLLAKAAETAKRAVAKQGPEHPADDESHLR